MRVCNSCGKALAKDELFCEDCGSRNEILPVFTEASAGGFCPNCGERFDAGTLFCSSCGTNVQSAAPTTAPIAAPTAKVAATVAAPRASQVMPQAMIANVKQAIMGKRIFNNKMIGIVGIGLLAVIVVTIIILIFTLFKSPSQTFITYQRAFIKEAIVNSLVKSADQFNTASGFSTDMNITANAESRVASSLLKEASLALKLNVDKKSVLANGSLSMSDEPVLSGELFYDTDRISVRIPELDPTHYSAKISSLAELADTRNAIDTSKLEIPTIDAKKLETITTAYSEILLSMINKENVTVLDKKRIRLDGIGKSVDATVYVFEPTAEEVEEMLNKLADVLEGDKDLRELVASFLGENKEFINENNDVDVMDSVDEYIAELADDIRYSADSAGSSSKRNSFKWTLAVSGTRVYMQKLQFGEDNSISYESEGDEGTKRTDGIYVSSIYDTSSISVDWSKKGSLYDGSVRLEAAGSLYAKISFKEMDLGKKSAFSIPYGRYDLSSDYDYFDSPQMELEVTAAKGGGTDHSLRIDGIDDYTLGDWIEVNVRTTDKKSTASKPSGKQVDLTGYDSEDLYDIMSAMSDELYDIAREYVDY